MHDIRAIRDNPQAFDEGLARRGLEFRADSLIKDDTGRVTGVRSLDGVEHTGRFILCADGAHSIFSTDPRTKRSIATVASVQLSATTISRSGRRLWPSRLASVAPMPAHRLIGPMMAPDGGNDVSAFAHSFDLVTSRWVRWCPRVT